MRSVIIIVALLMCGCTSKENSNTKNSKEYSTDEYEAIAEKAINSLVEKNADEFKTLLSPVLIRRTEGGYGEGSVDKIINERYMPFFEDLSRIETKTEYTATTDADGNKGVALYKTFISVQGEQKPFIVYVLNEKGTLVIGNLVLDKTLRDVEGQLKTQKVN